MKTIVYSLSMRLWTIHPRYLDAKGLVALWREALLAQKVLKGLTKGYVHHPQLIRFKKTENPGGAIGCYLFSIVQEADRRHYSFDKSKIDGQDFDGIIEVTRGQVDYEWEHLMKKLFIRDKDRFLTLKGQPKIDINPLFKEIEGEIESWENRI